MFCITACPTSLWISCALGEVRHCQDGNSRAAHSAQNFPLLFFFPKSSSCVFMHSLTYWRKIKTQSLLWISIRKPQMWTSCVSSRKIREPSKSARFTLMGPWTLVPNLTSANEIVGWDISALIKRYDELNSLFEMSTGSVLLATALHVWWDYLGWTTLSCNHWEHIWD